MLTSAQSQTLKSAILADGALAPLTSGPGTDYGAIASAMNLAASPAYWVWRTSVSRSEMYNKASPDATFWDWTIYKGQSVTEQNAWVQMFMGDSADFSQANLRAGIGKIFGAANAQTVHALAIGRRQATRAEKLLATGTGSAASPGVMSFEGAIQIADIGEIFNA